jgi:hypothetical protein
MTDSKTYNMPNLHGWTLHDISPLRLSQMTPFTFDADMSINYIISICLQSVVCFVQVIPEILCGVSSSTISAVTF